MVIMSAALFMVACGDKHEILRPADNEASVGGVLYSVASEAYCEPGGFYYITYTEATGGRLFSGMLHIRLDDSSLSTDLASWNKGVYYKITFEMDAYGSFSQENTTSGLHTVFNDVDNGGAPVFVKGRLSLNPNAETLICEVDGMLVNSDEFRLRLVVPQKDIAQL